MSDFAPCVAFTLTAEGGFSNAPPDPPTNFGITLPTLSDWRMRPCTVADVQALTRSEAIEIYQANYWSAVEGDYLMSGLDLMVFDFGVNVGPRESVILLQRILGVAQDGDLGPITLAAAESSLAVLRSRIPALASLQDAYYRQLSGFARYGTGWLARTQRRQAAAMALTIHAVPAAVTQET